VVCEFFQQHLVIIDWLSAAAGIPFAAARNHLGGCWPG
jgi:hypothetical protein